MSCCGSMLCFIGFHNYKKTEFISQKVYSSRKSFDRFEIHQCVRCCKTIHGKVYTGPIDKSSRGKLSMDCVISKI